ncbi:proline-rich transmembrane protein 3 [Sebastes fasciatus]|uniref:proline-rich transmembrane protein 3 n=1 Tax=Sebastes fasciatus TaxID=394691 RepID=UPI003D9F44D8
MGRSSLLFITLSLSSLGSLIQISHSLDNSVRITRSAGSELMFYSEGSSDSVEGSGLSVDSTASQTLVFPKKSERAGNENHSESGITLTTTPALTLHHSADKANTSTTGYTHSRVYMISEEEGSHVMTEEHLKESHTSKVNEDFPEDLDSPKLFVQNDALTPTTNQNLSGPAGPCVLSLGPCVVITNGTNLLWDDMRRTLAFAWELHVFGSAGLFILMAALAVVGLVGACTLPQPLRDALILANALLILSGSLRGFLLLLDPYGTRQILSRATLAALHNVPLQLLLWAQVALTLVALRGSKLLLFPLKLQHQHPWVVGGLAVSHCTLLLAADLFSPTLSPALPLLLQTLSLCWGLPFCMGILIKSFSHLHPHLWSSLPQWAPSLRIEKRAKRVTAVCAFFGFLCFSLQMYSLLWLYGLLGNWRRFSWGWWLSQFWARILELAWGFSLLVLGSWIFWTKCGGHSRVDHHGQDTSEVPTAPNETRLWGRVLASIQEGPLKNSERTWEDLMPSNWAKYNLSRRGFSNNLMCQFDDQPSPDYTPDPVSTSSSDSQAALLLHKVGERECVLSLIEFDMRPPSPINLRRSIDDALHHGQLVAEGLFTSPPPSWTQTMADTADGNGGAITLPPAYFGYDWTLDTEPISASPLIQPLSVTTDYNGSVGAPAAAHQGEEFNSAGMYQYDWCEDEVTDL